MNDGFLEKNNIHRQAHIINTHTRASNDHDTIYRANNGVSCKKKTHTHKVLKRPGFHFWIISSPLNRSSKLPNNTVPVDCEVMYLYIFHNNYINAYNTKIHERTRSYGPIAITRLETT